MSSIVAFSTAIGPVPLDCVLSEKPVSELDITEIAIETGSRITDHAVVMPKKVSLDIATGNAAATLAALIAFQESRVPFTLVTGFKIFPNMLIKGIYPERDATYSTVLRGRVELQEAIIVGTAYAADPEGDNADRGSPGGKKSTRSAPTTSERAKGSVTSDRASQTEMRGDAGVQSATTADRSLLQSLIGSGK